MRKGGGASKGSGFERHMARSLSSWWYGSPEYLWRRPGSGQIRSLNPNRHTGDIIPTADKQAPYSFPFHIECKFYKDLDLIKLITDPDKSFIKRTWDKATKEARHNLAIVLLVKQNRHKELVFLKLDTYVALGLDRQGSEIMFDDMDVGGSVLGFAWNELKEYKDCAQVYFDANRVEQKKS